MRNRLKMVSQAVIVLAALALMTSVANAQISRNFTMTCNNLGNSGAQIMSWTWLQADGTSIGGPLATVDTTSDPRSWNCGGGGLWTTTVDQPLAGTLGTTAGVSYSLHFLNSTSSDCTNVDGFVRPGAGVHFHDRCRDTDPNAANNAVVVIVLAN